jgi:hypothetical protein
MIMTDNYAQIVKLVIDGLKQEAKTLSTKTTNNWAGDAYYTEKELKTIILKRQKHKKGAEMLLEGLKLMGY